MKCIKNIIYQIQKSSDEQFWVANLDRLSLFQGDLDEDLHTAWIEYSDLKKRRQYNETFSFVKSNNIRKILDLGNSKLIKASVKR